MMFIYLLVYMFLIEEINGCNIVFLEYIKFLEFLVFFS